MSNFWPYFWPAIALGFLSGLAAGLVGFRSKARRTPALAVGAFAALVLAGLWHGPLGGAERLRTHAERMAREALDYYEMPGVTAHLHRGPLTRHLVLSGKADDFQTSELQRLMSQVPGVSRATWSSNDAGIPLIAEGAGAALLGFLAGLFAAYLMDLRRRHNAQWSW